MTAATSLEDLLGALGDARAAAEREIAGAASLEELAEVERAHLGKRSAWKRTSELMKDLAPDQRPAVGKALGELSSSLRAQLAARTAELEEVEAAAAGEQVDLTLPPLGTARGNLHIITQVQRELVDIFVGLGYKVGEGPEVESDWHNFQALNFPPGHPARDMHDTLYIDRGNGNDVLLRTQTSTVQVRTMEAQQPPVYVVAPGRVFRQETLDPRHSPVFHQIEGLAVDVGISMGDMFGTIQSFVDAYFGKAVRTRFQPSYFPFTEPSAEFAAECAFCEGAGCRVCSKTGWIEIGGCGMVDPNVLTAVGYDPEAVSGFAFGFGIERMAMLRYGIDNIGSLFANDVRFLRQF